MKAVATFISSLLLSAVSAVSGFAEDSPPNIVLILADDLGYGDLGCYGSATNKTPHIDALAAAGLRFADFHSSGAMCSPTRAATLTGLYQQRFGRKFDTALGGGSNVEDNGLPLEAVTIAEILREAGYATGCFGKWHLGYRPPLLPPDQGFDLFRGLVSGDGDFHTHIDRQGGEDWWHNNRLEPEEGYTTDLLTKHSVRFIEDHRDRPFFLYLPHLGIHFPWQGPDDPPHRQKGIDYQQDKWGIVPDRANVQPHVKAMIEALDRSTGTIVATIRDLGLAKKTLVIFTSDNGGYLTYAGGFRNISSNGPLRGQKTELFEGGHRVPTIFHWPGRIAPGVTRETAHSTDLAPTFCELAGIPVADGAFDGIDLAALLFKAKPLPRRMLFWRTRQARAARSGPWKYFSDGKSHQLFHLQNDLGETTDLAEKYPERLKELTAAWSAWEDSVNRSAQPYE